MEFSWAIYDYFIDWPFILDELHATLLQIANNKYLLQNHNKLLGEIIKKRILFSSQMQATLIT